MITADEMVFTTLFYLQWWMSV